MTTSVTSKVGGTQGSLQINGVDSFVFDATGVISGVNKSAVSQMPTLGTAVATTSGTSIDFTGIPSWVKRITLMLNGVSNAGTSNYLVQIGSGAIQTTGYASNSASGATVNSSTSGFTCSVLLAAASTVSGMINLSLVSGNIWVGTHTVGGNSGNITANGSGIVTLSGALDRIRLTTSSGTDTFDAGSINILYE